MIKNALCEKLISLLAEDIKKYEETLKKMTEQLFEIGNFELSVKILKIQGNLEILYKYEYILKTWIEMVKKYENN